MMRRTYFSVLLLALASSLIASSALLSPLNAATKPKVGSTCPKIGQSVISSGKTLNCVKSGKKKVWQIATAIPKPTPAPTPTAKASESEKFLYGKRIGMSCTTDGVFGFTGGGLAICKGKVVRYALKSDLPPAPTGGYKTRPDWYPTLSQQLGHREEPNCDPSSIQFTSPVIPFSQLATSVPYGAMIGGHVTPIDHAYIGIKSLYKTTESRTESDYAPVTSPADGTITSIGNLGSPTSIRVVIEHGCNIVTVYMVLNRLSGVLAQYAEEFSRNGANRSVSIPIKAGQEFAQQRDNPMDFNVWDGTQWLSGFANPFAYTSGDAWKPYTADPLPFFTPAIRSAMESVMQRVKVPRIGKIDWDILGSAAGNWFLDGTYGYNGRAVEVMSSAISEIPGGPFAGKKDSSWSHLAIAPNEVDNDSWIFSTGWWNDSSGDPHQFLLNADSGKPTPDQLTAADGIVVYLLTSYSYLEPAGSPEKIPGAMAPFAIGYKLQSGFPQGIVALQVNPDSSLSVEIDTTKTKPSEFPGFSSAKRTYQR